MVTSLKDLSNLATGGGGETGEGTSAVATKGDALREKDLAGKIAPKSDSRKSATIFEQMGIPAMRGGDTIYNQQRNYNFFSGGLTSEVLAGLK